MFYLKANFGTPEDERRKNSVARTGVQQKAETQLTRSTSGLFICREAAQAEADRQEQDRDGHMEGNAQQQQQQQPLDVLLLPLAGLLGIDCDLSNRLSLPQLVVNFWLIKGGGGAGSPHQIDAKVRPALQALAQVMTRSHELSASPAKKARFWRQVLTQNPRLFSGSTESNKASKLADWVLESEAFPHVVVLDFSRTRVQFELVDALGSFFRESTDAGMGAGGGSAVEQSSGGGLGTLITPRELKFGLKFVRSQLKSQDLLLVQQLLDQACSGVHRHLFHISSLDLSDNGMNTTELVVLAEILKKNDKVYRLDELVLENVVGRNMDKDGLKSLRALVEAAFDVDTIVKMNTTSANRQSPQHGLLQLNLQGNALSADAYTSICSALRHSRGVQELSLGRTLSLVNPIEREQCWRWLAFGLFCPRPSDLEEPFKVRKIDLSGNPLYPNDVEALRRTLWTPATELIGRGSGEADTDRLDIEMGDCEIHLCSVQKDTQIHSQPDIGSSRIFRLDHQTELEALCARGEWVCMLIPGFGLGWVQAECVERVDYSQVLGEDDQASQTRYELVLNSLAVNEPTSQALSSLFEIIGHHLCALELRHYRMDQRLFESVLRHCSQLERLDLEASGLIESDMTPLLDALRRDLGNRLISLNLNANFIGYNFVDQLARILSDRNRVPALQELRLHKCPIGGAGLTTLFIMLAVNKTLSMLELETPEGTFASLQHTMTAKYQGELLRIDSLPLDRKFAFLSAVVTSHSDPLAGESTARSALDTWMLAAIFQFAARDVRRRISWR